MKATAWLLCLTIMVALSGCGPGEDVVARDFEAFFAEAAGTGLSPVVTSMVTGEGDSDHVYYHVRFDAVAERDVVYHDGLFEGLSAKRGKRLTGGELVILYQQLWWEPWRAIWHDLAEWPRIAR